MHSDWFPVAHVVQDPQPEKIIDMTRSPAAKSLTPSPTKSTVPLT